MAIAKQSKRNRSATKKSDDERAAVDFISKAESLEKTSQDEKTDTKKAPVMVRFDRNLLSRVDEAAKHRGISRSAWIQFTLSRALDQGEG